MAELPVTATGVGGRGGVRDGGFADATGLDSHAIVVGLDSHATADGVAGRAVCSTASFDRVLDAVDSVPALEDAARRPFRPPLINLAYTPLFRPRGVMRPVSRDRTVARVTPTAIAACSSLSDFASRSLRRSLGEESGGAAATSGELCVMNEPPWTCAEQKST
jgi:hypothetical protein